MIKPLADQILSFLETTVVHCTDVLLRISSSILSVAVSKAIMEVAYGYHWLNNKNRQNDLSWSLQDRCQLDINAGDLSKNMLRLDGDMLQVDDGMDNLKLHLDAFEDMLGCFQSGVGNLREELGDLCSDLQEFLGRVDCESDDDYSSSELTNSETEFIYEVQKKKCNKEMLYVSSFFISSLL